MLAARAVEKAFADAKKSLPINVDGAIGAILADLGMNPAAFNGIFMIARTPGLVAHVIEEQTRERRCAGSIRSITALSGKSSS
jgi:citrate synthase